MRMTVIYSYYDNRAMFEELKEYYRLNHNPNLDFIFVDDGSPNDPLTAEDMLNDNWSLLRVKKDLGWNNEGCRNLAMSQTKTAWNLMTDLDHRIKAEDIPKMTKLPLAVQKKKNLLWTFDRVFLRNGKRKIHVNSFLVYKPFWDSFGGYDETYIGCYACDHLMGPVNRNQIQSDRAIGKVHPKIRLEVIGTGTAGTEWTTEKKQQDKLEWRSGQRKLTPTKKRVTFEWERIK